MKKRHFYLSVLFFRDGDQWLAQALEFDITAQGSTLAQAKRAFEQTLVGQIKLDRMKGRKPLEHLPPAPTEYWTAFEAATTQPLQAERFPLSDLPPAFMIEAISDSPLDAVRN